MVVTQICRTPLSTNQIYLVLGADLIFHCVGEEEPEHAENYGPLEYHYYYYCYIVLFQYLE